MLPNWYGIPGIGFEWCGSQSDALLHYNGHTFYEPNITDALWDNYNEDGGDPDNESEWVAYVIDNAVNYLNDLIWLGVGE